MINAIQEFKKLVAPEKTQVDSLFSLILVFGGNTEIEKGKYSSCRHVFVQWAHDTKYELAGDLRTPEDFPDEWNKFYGYSNLVEFERDAGCLTRGVLLFSESPGAFAELGAFCSDDDLCERLLVVLAEEHYDAISYISLGPIQLIKERHSEKSIYTVDTTDDPRKFEDEVGNVGEALLKKVGVKPKRKQFDAQKTRDQFLLIADLIELFGALTEQEIEILLKYMGVEQPNLSRMLNQLVIFSLIIKQRGKNDLYFIPPKQRTNFLNYAAPSNPNLKFDRPKFRLMVSNPELKKDPHRLAVYSKTHGVPR